MRRAGNVLILKVGNYRTDKQITWALCRQNELLWNTHAVELLPRDGVAVASMR